MSADPAASGTQAAPPPPPGTTTDDTATDGAGTNGVTGVPAPGPAPSDDDLASDLHDVFGMMYAGPLWDSDDDEDVGRRDDGFDLPRLLALLDSLVSTPTGLPSRKRRRIFPSRPTTTHIVTSTSPLPPLPPASTYAPFSPLPLLARLRTFGAAGISPGVPSALGARACAAAGWVSGGHDALVCARACGGAWGVAGLAALPERTRAGVVARLVATLSSRHVPGCAWRTTPSPPALVAQLRRALHPLTASSLAPLARAAARQVLGPLTPAWTSSASDTEIATLAETLSRYSRLDAAPGTAAAAASTVPVPPLAAALALFGWYPHDPTFPADHVVEHGPRTDIVQCRLCRRRVGLWAFTSGGGDGASSASETMPSSDVATARILDLGAAHLTWCPLRADETDAWWRECALVRARASEGGDSGLPADPVKLAALLGFTGDAPTPAKRWRRTKHRQAPVA